MLNSLPTLYAIETYGSGEDVIPVTNTVSLGISYQAQHITATEYAYATTTTVFACEPTAS